MPVGEKTKELWENPEYREKMIKAHIGLFKGRKHSEETKIKMRKKHSPFSEETKRKMSLAHKGKPREKRRGEKNPNWKGNKVTYKSLHDWVRYYRGTPKKCEHCGNENLRHRQYNWANKSHKYKRELSDWIRLCCKCHWKYDRK